MRSLSVASCLAAVVVAAASLPALAQDDFKPLFDGKSLDGWSGDAKLWSVADGVILGSTHGNKISKNSFLSTTKSYKNFVLKVKFKLHNGNSGIQIRSKQHPDHVVRGYQADIADNQFMGILYEEGGRGILKNVDGKQVAEWVKKGEWNEYVITCNGAQVKQELNGNVTVDFTDEEGKGAREGIIALQLHVGPDMKIEFKDIAIKELP